MSPRLGVLDFNPIQYHAPLYQRLEYRRNIEFDVLFLYDRGYHPAIDPGFGLKVAWDIDLLSGYAHQFLTTTEKPGRAIYRLQTLTRWLLAHDVIIIHGYSDPWMLCAIAICRSRRVPYILRGESHPQSQSSGLRRYLRHIVARTAVSGSAGGLAIGQMNAEFYRQYGARTITLAPYSVDDKRFAESPQVKRSDLLARLDLEDNKPVIVFCGKLIPRKRPLDLIAAVQLLPGEVNTLFVGDGPLAERIQASLHPGRGAVTGFVNQSELPSYYHAADILVLPSEAEPWGLVVNEAMAAGALPVVTDRVGSAPDLVLGIGEVYSCGDVTGLASALVRALRQIEVAGTREKVRRHVARYSLDRTVIGFEHATLAIGEATRSRRL